MLGEKSSESKNKRLKRGSRVLDMNKIIQENNVENAGFPIEILEVFIQLVDVHNHQNIVISRVPGLAAKGLIGEGYDVKGFHIKAKSCDWGPMAGFLCRYPLFNKVGLDKVVYNYQQYAKYLHYLNEQQISKSPFSQIQISNARKSEILDEKNELKLPYIKELKKGKIDIHINERVIKLDIVLLQAANNPVSDNDTEPNTVRGQFLLLQNPNGFGTNEDTWKLYQGKIEIFGSWNEKHKKKWRIFDNQDHISSFGLGKLPIEENTGLQKKYYDKIDEGLATEKQNNDAIIVTDPADAESELIFTPVYGVCNPASVEMEPTKKNKEEYGKRTVTGDYDLFSVWPTHAFKNNLDKENQLSRLTENGLEKKEDFSHYWMLKLNDEYYKQLTLKIVRSPHWPTWIEFIPHFKEIINLESKDEGNYNKIVKDTWEKLNDISTAVNKESGWFHREKKKKRLFPIAYHSDEGGRPSEETVDLPLAAFHPQNFLLKRGSNENKITYINSIFDFVDYLFEIKKHESKDIDFQLILNHCWVAHMCMLVVKIDELFIDFEDIRTGYYPNIDNLSSGDKKVFNYYYMMQEKYLDPIRRKSKKNEELPDNSIFDKKVDWEKELREKVVFVVFGLEFKNFSNDVKISFKDLFGKFSYEIAKYTVNQQMKAHDAYITVRNIHSELINMLNASEVNVNSIDEEDDIIENIVTQ